MIIEMPRMMLLPDGSAVEPSMIHVAAAIEGKGIIIKNEYNKLITVLRYLLAIQQRVIIAAINKAQSEGENWVQPDWDALLGAAISPAPTKASKASA